VSATITRHWGTGLVLTEINLTAILRDPLPAPLGQGPEPVQELPVNSVIADPERLKDEFLTSMNALAETHNDKPVTGIDLKAVVWQAGYDEPMTSSDARYVAWCFLACSQAPPNTESGALAFPDPRNASSQTAMPGLPWGRHVMVAPRPGGHVAAPGWTTHSIVPLARGQYSLVAIGTAVP
jgi:hypothetical protein